MTPDETRFLTTQRISEALRKTREESGSDHTALMCKAMMDAAFAELAVIEGDKQARLFIGQLTFSRDPHHQTDFVAWGGG